MMVRLVKMLGLAAVAAAIAMAFVGTSSAPAFWRIQTLCELNFQLCPVIYQHPLIQYFDSAATNSSFVSAIKEKCSGAELGQTTVEEGATETAIESELKELTFSGCEPCSSVTATGLPSKAELINGGAEQGNGFLVMSIEVTASSCPFGVKCTFSGKELELEFIGSSTEPKFIAKEEKLVLTGGSSKMLCGETGAWTATYVEKYLPSDFLVPEREHML